MHNRNPKTIDILARKIWSYLRLGHKLEKADCILVMGSHDLRVAERGAELFLRGFAPLLIFSGGIAHKDDLLATKWNRPEAEVFAEVAIKMGVPKDKILIENKSINTGENIIFTQRFFLKHHLDPQKIIVAQKPYMERRAYAALKKRWPDKKIIMASPRIPYKKYPNKDLPKDVMINAMAGYLQRIRVYPKKGFQIPQKIPPAVWSAFEKLVALGYNKHLIK